MSPLRHSTNVAARMGRWSARHRKTAIFGWLAFVVASFAIGTAIGMQTIDQNDSNVGEARRADHIIRDGGFSLDEQSEYVLVQSPTATVSDPAFRAVVADAIAAVERFPQVTKLRSPLAPGNEGQVSADRHSALIQFTPDGSYDDAVTYIDSITAATDAVQKANPDYYVGEAGSASTGKALDEMFGSQLARAGLISIPITLAILLLVFGSLVAASIPLLLALTSVFATLGLVALTSQFVPMDESVSEVILLIGLAVGIDYSLFYIRRERDERRVGKSESAALEAAAATSGRAVLISGITVMIAMAGMFFSGDKTFMSFAIGTMTVVAVAMIGSLTVLPAMLAWLGDRVEKVRVPLLWRVRRTDGDSRVWGWILDRVLRHPLASAAGAVAVLVVLALPAFNLHTAISGLDALPKSLKATQSYNRVNDAFPGGATPAVVAISGDTSDPALRAAVADLEDRALASGKALEPIRVEVAPGGEAMRVAIPLVGQGNGQGVERRARDPARRAPAGDRRHRRRHRVRGHRRHGGVEGLERRDEVGRPRRLRLRPGVRVPAPARLVPVDRHPA